MNGLLASCVHSMALSDQCVAARPLYERALALQESHHPEHPDTALTLNNLAGLLRAQGDLAAARPLYERALAINESHLGPEHPYTALSLNNLAGVLHSQGERAAARSLYERALHIFEVRLGPDHRHTVRIRRNLTALMVAVDMNPLPNTTGVDASREGPADALWPVK